MKKKKLEKGETENIILDRISKFIDGLEKVFDCEIVFNIEEDAIKFKK